MSQGITTGSADALDKAQVNCSLRYQSKWQHQSGLVNFGFRFYNPATARWMSRDPLGEAGGLNLYAYAGGDPINHFDPNGLNPIDTFKAWVNRSLFGDEKKPCESGEAGDSDFAAAGQLADNNQRGIRVSATLAKHAYNGIYNEAPKQLMFGAAAKGAGIFIGALRSVPTATTVASDAASIADHAVEKHIVEQGEFPGWIRTRNQLQEHVVDVINNPTSVRNLSNGRTAYWQEGSSTVVIRNSGAASRGTVFQPTDGITYFNNLR